MPTASALDLTVAMGGAVVDTALRVTRVAKPLIMLLPRFSSTVMATPLGVWLAEESRRGEERRLSLRRDLDSLVDTLVPQVVDVVLERLDLTRVVRQHVDVNEVARDVDLQAIVARLDLARLAEEVIDAVDLPEIIRESSGSVASETVRTVRMRGVAGDSSVSRVTERLFRRRRSPGTEKSTEVGAGSEPYHAPDLLPSPAGSTFGFAGGDAAPPP
jgi:hypothetical protein